MAVCKLLDLPAAGRGADIRFFTHAELAAVVEVGVPDDDRGCSSGRCI